MVGWVALAVNLDVESALGLKLGRPGVRFIKGLGSYGGEGMTSWRRSELELRPSNSAEAITGLGGLTRGANKPFGLEDEHLGGNSSLTQRWAATRSGSRDLDAKRSCPESARFAFSVETARCGRRHNLLWHASSQFGGFI